MSLERFCDGRLVMLRTDASAYDAASAMMNNRVGAVLVVDGGELAGIATDRDLLLRAGSRLRLDQLPLREVMTPHPVCVDSTASIADVVAQMRQHRIRRIVVRRDGRPAGLVTLDDLILMPSAGREELEDIVLAQLEQSAAAKPGGEVRPLKAHAEPYRRSARSAAHRAQTLRAFVARLIRITGLRREVDALAAFEVFASGIAGRLNPNEAKDFAAQLPADLRERLPPHGDGSDRRITRGSIERDMARRLEVDPGRATELVWRLGQHFSELVSEGEARDVVAQLPKNLQSIFEHAA